jgi:hypothetical protein
MGIVRMHDVRFQALDDAGQPPGGGEVHFRARRDRDQLETLVGAAPQHAVRMCDQCRPMTERVQAVDRQQDLVLAAAPGSRRVDVK